MTNAANSPTAVSYPPKAPRYQVLDAWRGVACLLMVVFHATMQMTGWYQTVPPEADSIGRAGQTLIMATARTWIGVPIFFVISGYCIMATLDSRRRRGAGVGRVCLAPLLAHLPAVLDRAGRVGDRDLAERIVWQPRHVPRRAFHRAESLGAEPGTMVRQPHVDRIMAAAGPWCRGGGDRMTNLLPNTWTLCYEEQFYLIAGLVLWLAPRRIFLSLALVTVATVVVKTVAHRAGVDLFGTFLDGRWLILAAGIAVYYRINYATRWQAHLIHLSLLAGIAANFFGPGRMLDWEPTKDLERFAGFAFALVISLTYRWDRQLMSTAVAKMFAWVGGMSYSVYLIHPLVTKGLSHELFRQGYRNPWFTMAVVVPACLVLSVLASRVFYHLVEKPFSNAANEEKKTSKQPAEVMLPELRGTPGFALAQS